MPSKRPVPEELKVCRVCGRRHESLPWGHDGRTPSFEICPCCGTEFGYDDATRESVLRRRALWRAAGYVWQDPVFQPAAWDKEAQMKQIPEDYSEDHT